MAIRNPTKLILFQVLRILSYWYSPHILHSPLLINQPEKMVGAVFAVTNRNTNRWCYQVVQEAQVMYSAVVM